MINITLGNKIKMMLPKLNEKQRRQYLASEAMTLGYGGIATVCRISGASRNTVVRGIEENQEPIDPLGARIRKVGGGRKSIFVTNKGIVKRIEELVSSKTFGNPEKALLWTTKSLRKIQEKLNEENYKISHEAVGSILVKSGYSLQLNQKLLQAGPEHPDKNAQFRYINNKANEFIDKGLPVISVDTKKKENVGNFKNNGVEYCKKGCPTQVLDHDFPIKELGKVAPYGVYDVDKNTGFINLGTSKDTSEFAAQSILRWWQVLGKNTYPDAKDILINCDGGGSNSSRGRLWKKQLLEIANITKLKIHVTHFPPGTSKWNKIEHKMFCYITKNWRGKPLISIEAIINLISNTTTKKGLTIKCVEDKNVYEIGQKVSDEEFAEINKNIKYDDFHGNWNYCVLPSG